MLAGEFERSRSSSLSPDVRLLLLLPLLLPTPLVLLVERPLLDIWEVSLFPRMPPAQVSSARQTGMQHLSQQIAWTEPM